MNYKRRDFIKIGSLTIAGTIMIPPFLKSCKGLQLSDKAESYMDHFEVTVRQMEEVIKVAMSKGADYADLFFEHTLENYASLEDGKVDRAYSNVDFGVGIRVLKGEQTGYAFSEDLSLEAMLKAARTAANIADSQKDVLPVNLTEYVIPDYYPVKISWEDTSVKDKIPYLQKVNDRIIEIERRVTKVKATIGDST